MKGGMISMKTWNGPDIVSLDVQKTMSSITPKEEFDGVQYDFFKSEDNPNGDAFRHDICS